MSTKRQPIDELITVDDQSSESKPTEAAIEALAALLIDLHCKRQERLKDHEKTTNV